MATTALLSVFYSKLKPSPTNTPDSTPSTTHSATFTPAQYASFASSLTSLVPSEACCKLLSAEDLTREHDERRRFTTFPPPSLTQQALAYLRTQVPYHPAALSLASAYHAAAAARRRGRGRARGKQSAADLACGAAQLGAWAASAGFESVHARDLDAEMVGLARGTSDMSREQRGSVELPYAEGETWDVALGSALEPNLAAQSVDLLMIGSAAHLFDWSSPSSSSQLYNTWAHTLRPHGTLLLLCVRPVPSSPSIWALLESAPFTSPLSPYFDADAARLGAVSMHAALPMPWDAGVLAPGWERGSRVYKVYDCVEGLADEGTVPKWLAREVRRRRRKQGSAAAKERALGQESLSEKWTASTPRALADWLRSTTGYARYLAAHPTERAAAGHDGDYAARAVRAACAAEGLGYDEPVGMRYPTAVLLLRRDGSAQ